MIEDNIFDISRFSIENRFLENKKGIIWSIAIAPRHMIPFLFQKEP